MEKIIDVDRVMLIVVGAHLAAEVSDRPLAYRLREAALRWIDARETDADADDFEPLEPLAVIMVRCELPAVRRCAPQR